MEKQTFDFDKFLKDKGFAFTNYGTHNLYEVAHEGNHYSVNLQGAKMTTNESRTSTLNKDIASPKDAESAEKWYNEFFGRKQTKAEEAKPAKTTKTKTKK